MNQSDPPDPGDLRRAQQRRVEREAHAAAELPAGSEARTHERRAEKAAYLRDKLAEQEASDVDPPDG